MELQTTHKSLQTRVNHETSYFGFAPQEWPDVVKMSASRIAAIALISLTFPLSAKADFQVTGTIRGRQCDGFLVFVRCKDVTIDAITTPASGSGELFKLEKSAVSSTEYDARSGTCFVRIQSGTTSLFGGILVSQFLEKQPDGSFSVVNPSVLTFPCAPD